MTTEAAVSFAERLKSDEAFRARLAGLESPAERLALVRAEGFDLTADDGPAVERALGLQELGDAELEHVVGGIFEPPPTDVSGSAIFVN